MRLADARLCLDCEELHDMEHCPVCGSETFAFVTRWVKSSAGAAPDRPLRPRRQTLPPERSEQLDAYRGLLEPSPPSSRAGRVVTGSALGLALIGLARLAWRAIPSVSEETPGERVRPPRSKTSGD
jgi:hypothetical protein